MNAVNNTPEGKRPPMRRWVKVLLALSLAVNLAVLGLAAGAALRWHGGDKGHGRGHSIGRVIFQDLDDDTRKALRAQVQGEHSSPHARRRAEANAVMVILRQKPFDAGALRQLLGAQAEARHLFFVSAQGAWVTQLEAMEPDARQRHLEGVLERLQGRGKPEASKHH